MNTITTRLKSSPAAVRGTLFVLLIAGLLLAGGTALASSQSISRVTATVWAPPRLEASRLAQTDPRIIEVTPIQSIAGEPLVIGKDTVVRVRVGAAATRANPLDMNVKLSFDGQELAQDAHLTKADSYVDFFPAAPSGEAHDVAINASIELPSGAADSDSSNNSVELSWPTVLLPKTTLKVFYLPVDWTAAAMAEAEFDSYFDAFVEEDTAFAQAVYPLPGAQVISDSTHVPHMLAEDERQIVDNNYVYNDVNTINLFASTILTGKSYAPDAELVAAVLPPRWLQDHANPRTGGFASTGVSGVTIVLLGGIRGAGTVIAHEFGHIRQLIDDYNPESSGYTIDRQGYWVARKKPITTGRSSSPYSFMGAGGTAGVDAWVDSRTYDHLLAKYVSEGGSVSRPMVLAATLAPSLDNNGAPTYGSAGQRLYDPAEQVVLTVAQAGLAPGTVLKARWLRGAVAVGESEKTVEDSDFGYTTFVLNPPSGGQALGDYRFELLSGDTVVKEGDFSVISSWLPDMSIMLGDNKADGRSGYRAGLGVSPVSTVQQSVFVPSFANDITQIYGWFVAQSDGESAAKDYDVDLRFFDPSGKQYPGEWVDDSKVKADRRITAGSYARKALKIAGTSAASATGAWQLAGYVDGREVGRTLFTIGTRGAASEFDRARDALRAAGIKFVDISYFSGDQIDSGLVLLRYNPTDTTDPYSDTAMREVWAAYNTLLALYPDVGTMLLHISWGPRYNLSYFMEGPAWPSIAAQEPSLSALQSSTGYSRTVYDLMSGSNLSAAQTTRFYTDRFGR